MPELTMPESMEGKSSQEFDSQPNSLPSRWKRCLISCFVLLNLSTVIWVNLPEPLTDEKSKWIDHRLNPYQAYRVRYAAWRWQQYAHYVGLDNRWQMFGRQSRFNWWYDIRAIYSDSLNEESVLLPLPNQSARSFAERYLFDLKERKFELNIYRNPVAREAYSRYLARQFPTHHGLPIRSIRWHLGTQRILPPNEAVAKQKLHDDHANIRFLNDFKIDNSPQRFVHYQKENDQ
jgi:hypothetical protein